MRGGSSDAEPMNRRRRRVLVTAACCAWTSRAAAQSAGQRPIRLIVPFPPGASADAVGRLLAAGIGRALGVDVVVDNVPGAAGRIGVAQLARSTPDGRTIGLGFSSTLAIAPALYRQLPYDAARDFTPIARIGTAKTLVLADPSTATRSIADLLALARRTPDPLPFGSWGVGSAGHMVIEAIGLHGGVRFTHVPYQGVAPVLLDLMGGRIGMGTADVGPALGAVRAGRLLAHAVTGTRRSISLPEVPTLRESGVPLDVDGWYALFAPAHVPPPVVDRLVQAAQASLRSDVAVQALAALGLEADGSGLDAFERQWHDDMASWARIVRAGGIKPE